MERKLFKSAIRFLVTVILAFACSCEPGDDEAPGEIDDLSFFWDALALTVQDGKVFIAGQTWPPNTRSLALTATGDNDDEGEATQYDLRYFFQSELADRDFEDDWDDAHRLGDEKFPSPAGEIDVLLLPRLDPSKRYYFAIRAKDEVGQESEVSNVSGPVTVPMIAIPVLSNNGNDFGTAASLAGIGDFNVDGHPDFAVGDPVKGKALIYFGMDEDEYTFRKEVEGADVHRARKDWLPGLTFRGPASEAFGEAVAAGYVNLSPLPDLLVGAPEAKTQAGRIYLFYGMEDMESPVYSNEADSIFTGDAAGDMFGAAVAGCKDLNGDGYDDFAVSGPGAEMAYVFLGGSGESSRGRLPGRAKASEAAALIILAEAPGDELGAAIDCGMDVNGDGLPDLAVSAPGSNNRGAVYIFFGGNAGVVNFRSSLKDPGSRKVINLAVKSADVTIRGTVDGARFGQEVSLVGNLFGREGSGFTSDLAVGATGLDPGRVFVFYGGDEGNVLFPEDIISPVEAQDVNRDVALTGDPGQGFGAAIAGGWDMNYDGSDDLVVGAPAEGTVIVFLWDRTKGGQKMPDYQISHPDPASGFGGDVLGLPDLNLDDLPELLIAAPEEGRVYFEF